LDVLKFSEGDRAVVPCVSLDVVVKPFVFLFRGSLVPEILWKALGFIGWQHLRPTRGFLSLRQLPLKRTYPVGATGGLLSSPIPSKTSPLFLG